MAEPLYDAGLGLVRALFTVLRTKRTVIGAENLPKTGGAVLAATHFGYLEFGFVAVAVRKQAHRRIRFLVIKGAFKNPVVGWALRTTKQIPVDKAAGAAAYDAAIADLRGGELVGVFPEGGVSISFSVRQIKSGAVRLAHSAGVPLIPIALWGGQRLATRAHTIRLRDRFGIPVSMVVGQPMTLSGDADTDTAALHEKLQQMVGELQASYPDDGAGQWWESADRGGTAPVHDDETIGRRFSD